MAKEVLVEEYGEQIYNTKGNFSGAALGKLITTQILDIGAVSAAFNQQTKYVIVQSLGLGFWAAPGSSAAPYTAGNVFVPPLGSREFPVDNTFTTIDTAG